MDLMHKNHIPFGVSICYTSKNYKVVTSDEFLDMLISKGCFFAWYFHYMPVGMGATTDLLLNPEQRAYMKDRVREIRGLTGGKEIFAIDFQNDGEFHRRLHRRRQALLPHQRRGRRRALRVYPLFRREYPRKELPRMSPALFRGVPQGQPFNNNHLRPCPMLENPDITPDGRAQRRAFDRPGSARERGAPVQQVRVLRRLLRPEAEKLWDEEHHN